MKNSDKFWLGVGMVLCFFVVIASVLILWKILLAGAILIYFIVPIFYFLLEDLELKNMKEDWWMWLNPIYWGIIAILLFNKWLDGLKF